MFGVLIEDDRGWGRLGNARFARRSFRDVDWGAVAAAGISLTANVVNAVAQGSRTQNTSVSCPAGYKYNPSTRMCDAVQQSGSSFFSNIDPTMLAIGAGLIVLVLTRGD